MTFVLLVVVFRSFHTHRTQKQNGSGKSFRSGKNTALSRVSTLRGETRVFSSRNRRLLHDSCAGTVRLTGENSFFVLAKIRNLFSGAPPVSPARARDGVATRGTTTSPGVHATTTDVTATATTAPRRRRRRRLEIRRRRRTGHLARAATAWFSRQPRRPATFDSVRVDRSSSAYSSARSVRPSARARFPRRVPTETRLPRRSRSDSRIFSPAENDTRGPTA